MPERKRQHFLAQQHMRRWSNTGKSVSALDKNVPKIIELVSIRNTGQQDHYYEKKPVGVEAALGELEGKMKEATDSIHEREELPTLEEEHRFTLRAPRGIRDHTACEEGTSGWASTGDDEKYGARHPGNTGEGRKGASTTTRTGRGRVEGGGRRPIAPADGGRDRNGNMADARGPGSDAPQVKPETGTAPRRRGASRQSNHSGDG